MQIVHVCNCIEHEHEHGERCIIHMRTLIPCGEKLLLSALEHLQVVYEQLLPPSRMGGARLCRF